MGWTDRQSGNYMLPKKFFWRHKSCRKIIWKTAILRKFRLLKAHNSVKNQLNIMQLELCLHLFKVDSHTKYHWNMSNHVEKALENRNLTGDRVQPFSLVPFDKADK